MIHLALFPPINVQFNNNDAQTKAVVVKWTLPPKRYTGFKFTVNNRDKECAVIDSSASNRFLTFCSLFNDTNSNEMASYEFKNLNPGTQYNMTIRTYKGSYHQEFSKEEIIQVFTGTVLLFLYHLVALLRITSMFNAIFKILTHRF